MAKAYTQKARKAQGTCRVCREEIEPGQTYTAWYFRFRGTLKLHEGCINGARRSWFTGSEILSTIWDLVDDFVAEGETPEEIADSLQTWRDDFEAEVIEGLFQEKLDNMEGAGTGLENTPVYEELESRKDELESFLSEVESVISDIENAEDEDLEDLRERAHEIVGQCPE